jgi:hypothetical protein
VCGFNIQDPTKEVKDEWHEFVCDGLLHKIRPLIRRIEKWTLTGAYHNGGIQSLGTFKRFRPGAAGEEKQETVQWSW